MKYPQNDIKIRSCFEKLCDHPVEIRETNYKKFQFEKHFHQYYTILLVEEGINVGFTEKINYEIGPGSVLIINPGELHAGQARNNNFLRFKSLIFDQKLIERVCNKFQYPISDKVTFHQYPIVDPEVSTLLKEIFYSRQLICTDMMEEQFIQLFSILFTNYRYNTNRPRITVDYYWKPYLSRSLEYLKDRFQEKITLGDLAEYARISPYHLVREFKAAYGQTPFQFLRNYRIENAKRMLLADYSSQETAYQMGFCDQSHFTKIFFKMEGMLPSDYRKSFPNDLNPS